VREIKNGDYLTMITTASLDDDIEARSSNSNCGDNAKFKSVNIVMKGPAMNSERIETGIPNVNSEREDRDGVI
jgi:hypothetical protein